MTFRHLFIPLVALLLLALMLRLDADETRRPNVVFIAIDDRADTPRSSWWLHWSLPEPGVTPGQVCNRPAELLDLYPTLAGLAGLPDPAHVLEGLCLVPQLRAGDAPRARPALSNHNQGNHAVITEDWRFIRYVDGAEELYDIRNDPHEWTNLAAARPEVRAELRKHLPVVDRGPAPGSGHRVLTYYDGTPVWEGMIIGKDDPIPHDTP